MIPDQELQNSPFDFGTLTFKELRTAKQRVEFEWAKIIDHKEAERDFWENSTEEEVVIERAGSAVQVMLVDRKKTHGDFSDNARCAERFATVMITEWKGVKATDVQIQGMDYIFKKLARIITGSVSERDHWVDIAGYAELVVKELDELEAQKRDLVSVEEVDSEPSNS